MRKTTKIALAVGAALTLGLAAAELTAHPSDGGYGPGYGMGGYGMGYGMHGNGMGYGMGPGAGMGYGMHGYGPGYGMCLGAGTGYGMHGYGAFPGQAEDRLADLKSQLGITAQQEPAWQAFVASAKQREQSREAWFAKMREARAAGSLPEMLAQRDEMFKQQQAESQAATAALKDLYAALSPEQKAIADERFGGFGPRVGAGYGRGGRFR